MPSMKTVGRYAVCVALVLIAVSAACASTSFAPEKTRTLAANEGALQVNVTDEAGRPIDGANVTISGNSSYWHTSANGTVRIFNITVGGYLVNATMVGYINDTNNAVSITNGNLTYVTLVIHGETLSGFVFNKDNVGIDNANVSIIGHPWWTMSAPDGGFSLLGIPTGDYSVYVTATNYAPDLTLISVTVGVPIPPKIFKLNFSLGVISGAVTNGTAPIDNATVSVVVDKLTISTDTDLTGAYSIPGIPTGNYTITASKEGYNDAVQLNASVTNGTETIVNFILTDKLAMLHGTVTATISAGSVLVFGAGVERGERRRNDTTGPQGNFEILNIPVGTYTIRVTANGYNTTTLPNIDFGRGKSVDLEIDLVPLPGQLTGVVRGEDNHLPLSGYRVTISGPEKVETYTNEFGQYVFAGLSSGNYTLTVEAPNGTSRYSPYVASGIVIVSNQSTTHDVLMGLVKKSLGGFIFGMDLPHSFMVLAFFITIAILSLAAYLRLKKLSEPASEQTDSDVDELDASEIEEKEEEPPGRLD